MGEYMTKVRSLSLGFGSVQGRPFHFHALVAAPRAGASDAEGEEVPGTGQSSLHALAGGAFEVLTPKQTFRRPVTQD